MCRAYGIQIKDLPVDQLDSLADQNAAFLPKFQDVGIGFPGPVLPAARDGYEFKGAAAQFGMNVRDEPLELTILPDEAG
ncbi:MAG TPA: hypothetical protein VME69_08300, partial [Methylocella sp.]|nr:hypothetical protein [Methylocella sp.]